MTRRARGSPLAPPAASPCPPGAALRSAPPFPCAPLAAQGCRAAPPAPRAAGAAAAAPRLAMGLGTGPRALAPAAASRRRSSQQQRLGAGGVARAGGHRGVQLIVHGARRAALDLARAAASDRARARHPPHICALLA